eukprot:TRINITY_DN39384_c0_g1_i1.p1 TRINITY_DN39384_c0_g1~~TRINITY_DN39384_c0_g1_i1.p1  ORF type:complete len:276 (+),score=74.88 TRINITY_DN39384_c0_g1_i1:61-888(+)
MFLHLVLFFFLMIRRPPRSTLSSSSAASDVYKRQVRKVSLTKSPEVKQSRVEVHRMQMEWTSKIRNTVIALKTNFADKYRSLVKVAEDLLSEGGRTQACLSPSSANRTPELGPLRRAKRGAVSTPRKGSHSRSGSIDVASLSLDMLSTGESSPGKRNPEKKTERLYHVEFIGPQVSLQEGEAGSLMSMLMVANKVLIEGLAFSEAHTRTQLSMFGFKFCIPNQNETWLQDPLASDGGHCLMVPTSVNTVSYTHLRAHETPEHLVCRLLLEKKKIN